MKKIAIPILMALCLGAAAQQTPARTFEEALAKVAAYETGDSRTPLAELDRLLAADAASPQKASAMEAALIKALEGKATLAGKDRICRHLSVVGSAKAVPVLSRLLSSSDTADMARYALERIPGAEVDAALRAMLPKTSDKVRVGIVHTLGQRRDAASVDALRKLISGKDEAAAGAAAFALGRIGGPRATAALAAVRPKTSGAVRAEVDEAWLICAEQSSDPKSAFAVFKQLSLAGERSQIRIGALRGLAGSGTRAVPLVAGAVNDADANVQAQAIRALTSLPGPEPVAALRQAFPSLAPVGKVRVLSALAERGDKAALPLVLDAAKDSAQPVRAAAFAALGKLGDGSVVPLLAETAASGKEGAGGADVPAERSGGLPNEREIEPAPAVTEQAAARESLCRLPGKDVDAAIVAGIAAAQPAVKVELIKAAAERADVSATDALLAAAADSNRDVRRAALRALRATAAPSHLPALLRLIETAGAEADRVEAARAVSSVFRRFDGAQIGPVVTAYSSSRTADVKGALLAVLAQTGREESLPVLRTALKDDSADIRRGAILALSEWPSAAPLADLLDIAKSDANPAFQILALRGYIRLAGTPGNLSPAETVRALQNAMGLARRAEEKKAALAIAGRIVSKDTLALAEAAMNDPEVAAEAKVAADRIRQRLAPRRQ